ncbi:MAG: hypothetical protein V4633_20770 [Pseudomonadota bacterium]
MHPELFTRAWKFALFSAMQGALCLALALLAGLLQVLADTAPGKVNEFAGLHLVIGLWLAPIYWLLATQAHLYFYLRRQAPARHILSCIASACVVLAGSVLMIWLASHDGARPQQGLAGARATPVLLDV